MNISNQIIASLDEFVQTIGDSQFVPQQKFLFEMIYGMIASGSVVMADIGRHLEQGTELIHIADQITRDTTISVDIGDIRKDYASKMENLCEVWDGSRREKATGYWLLQIEAHHNDGRRTGIYTDAWSQEAEDFASRNRIVLEAIGRVAEAFGGKGVYIEDRGGDGQEIILGLDELGVCYIVCQRGDRHVRMIGTSHDKSVRAVAQEVKLKGSIDVWHRHRDGRWELKHLRYGWCGV